MARGKPLITPLGDSALLVRFGDTLDDDANRAAIGFARQIVDASLPGVLEVVPNLASVLVRYDAREADYNRVAGEVRTMPHDGLEADTGTTHTVAVKFEGADIGEVARLVHMDVHGFIAAHNEKPLRVLTTGFAPGFVYCGFHPPALHLPRRAKIRRSVPAGTVIFAAGQTAIAATPIPTGWHVIGTTEFRNFDPRREPPTVFRAGDTIRFEVAR